MYSTDRTDIDMGKRVEYWKKKPNTLNFNFDDFDYEYD